MIIKNNMWRVIVLAILYVPWMFVYMTLAFLVLYSPAVIVYPILWGYQCLYGVICFCWLKGNTKKRFFLGMLVPIPVLLYFFGYDLNVTGDLGRSAKWLFNLLFHGMGLIGAMLCYRFVRG